MASEPSSTCWSSAAGWSAPAAALDAATRGLRVGLVEARDLASGTSSRSSKLIHGGLRYLEMLDFGLVREALAGARAADHRELAPHLVRPVPFLYPLQHRVWERPYVGLRGPALRHDGAARRPGRAAAAAPPAPHPARRAAGSRRPAQGRAHRRHAVLRRPGRRRPAHHDHRAHRGRATARWSRPGPGSSASCARASGSPARGCATWRATATIEVRARQVINATGVWTDETQALVGAPRPVPRARVQGHAPGGAARPDPVRRRRSSCGPRRACCSSSRGAGTGSSARPTPTGSWTRPTRPRPRRHRLPARPRQLGARHAADHRGRRGRVRRAAAAAGRRVRVDLEAVPRARGRRTPAPGLVVVAGGKYTTYRVMAKDAVDAAAHGLDEQGARSACTDRVPLVGAEGYAAAVEPARADRRASGLHVARIEHLLGRYGTLHRRAARR